MPARKYNPNFLTDEELIASFCVRTAEFEVLLDNLRGCTGSSNPHQIVIGPRGSGKTSLLLRVAAEARRDPELAACCFPIVFAEESYEVATVGEFWLECLTQLAAQAPHEEGDPDLHRTAADLRAVRDDHALADRCLGTLLDFADRNDQRLLLLVENLNTLFRDMVDPDVGWRLRKILQTEPRVILFASATSRFEEIDHPDHALYDLFGVHTLRPLNTRQCAVLWESISDRAPAHGTVRSLEILTGGNPRLISIVARFGAGLSFRELMADLLDLVDDHTEYFKSHIEALPAQERRVYLALATLWKPATTREIAGQARLDTSTCSAHLARLGDRGAVQVAGGSVRRKQYYLSERLYNIYYLLRRRRGPDRLVEALIRFMEAFYSPSEMKEISIRIAGEVGDLDAARRQLYSTAFTQLVELPALSAQELNRPDDALAAWEEVEHRFGVSAPENLHEPLATALVNRGALLRRTDRFDEALAIYNDVVRRFGDSDATAVLVQVGRALYGKAAALDGLNRPEEVLVVCDDVLHRFGTRRERAFRYLVATILVKQGVNLRALDRPDDALDAWNEVIRRFGSSETTFILEQVANALVNKGVVLHSLNRREEAIAAYEETVRRYADSGTSEFQAHVAQALVNKGELLCQPGRFGDAVAVCDEVVDRFGTSDMPILREQVANALVNKAVASAGLNLSDEALAVCDDVIGRFGTSWEPALVGSVALALANRAVTLGRMGRSEDALATWHEAVRRLEKSDAPELCSLMELALLEKANMEIECRQLDSAIKTAGQLLDRCTADSPETRLRGHVIRSKAALARADWSVYERDVESVLDVLPELNFVPKEVIDALMRFSIERGPERTRELIQASPATELLMPLLTVFEEDLGLEPRVAHEVRAVANDIRAELAKLTEAEQAPRDTPDAVNSVNGHM